MRLSLISTAHTEASPEGGYWSQVPALSGCFSQGETLEETIKNTKGAIELYLEGYTEEGKEPLRRFYYGADFGPKEKSTTMSAFSAQILDSANMNGFEVIEKRVKYIHNSANKYGYEKKCDLDVEMVVDLIQERDNYDHIILFSGDGDLVRALEYLHKEYGKQSIVMSARGHIAREVIDANRSGVIEKLLYAEDFAYRLQFSRRG